MVKSSAKQIAFRVDASTEIGTGHVMRCLTLADTLRQKGATSLFLCRPHQGHLLDVISKRGHEVVALPEFSGDWRCEVTIPSHASWLGTSWQQDAEDTLAVLAGRNFDWLVVDHYALDAHWQDAVKTAFHNLLVIDDLADRRHACDLLLDQNLGRTKADYTGLLGLSTKALIGPEYALLRPEFAQLRSESLDRRKSPQLKRILITMGGVDKANVTSQVLRALDDSSMPDGVEVVVVMGSNAPWLDQVRETASQMKYKANVLVGVSNMARLMTDSDYAIGAAGSTSWERCCLGLPSMILVIAENQWKIAEALDRSGAATLSAVDGLKEALNQVFSDDSLVRRFRDQAERAGALGDGLGADRIAIKLIGAQR